MSVWILHDWCNRDCAADCGGGCGCDSRAAADSAAAGGAGFDLHQTDFPCAGLGSGAFVAKAYLNLLADEFLDVHSSGGDEGPVAAGRISGDGELLPFAADRTYIHEPLLAHRAGVASGVLDGEQGARGVGQVDLRGDEPAFGVVVGRIDI